MLETVRFGDLFASPLRNGVSYPSKLRGTGVPMVNMREIFAFERIADQECERVPLTEAERSNYLLEPGDLLFARQSLTFEGAGKCVLVLPAPEPRTWEGHLMRVRLDDARAHPGFYYYYFASPRGRKTVEAIIQQVAAAGIRGSDLANLLVPALPLADQRAIAEVLTSLDDKIVANSRFARLADELVRAKYHALAGDRVPLGSIAANVRDQVDPKNIAAETPYVGLEHVPRRTMWLSDFETAAKVSSAKASFGAGDVLFGKLRPYFHKVVSAPFSGIASTDILILRAFRPELRGLVLAAASSDAAIAVTTASSEGTRMPRTKWAALAAVEVPWPGDDEARRFSDQVCDLADWAAATAKESRELATTRDGLLPLLMSGKVCVRDALKSVEGVL